MMVDGAEEGQLKGPIDLLAPYRSTGEESTVVPSMGSLAVVGKRSGGGARRRQTPSASAAEVRVSR